MNDNFWLEEPSSKPSDCKKRKRIVGKRKIDFIGWGSRPLIEFLETIGMDTTKKLTEHELIAVINKYINDKGLTQPGKKKKVLCDERLLALFGKKTFPRTKIRDMLEDHFADNHDDSDDDEHTGSSDEEYVREKKSNPSDDMKKVPETPKSCFAAAIMENIKLVYLKRTLIQELLKVPESFECKILGSYVRMRSDPNDIYQKNRFQLQLVTGIEKVSEAGGAGSEVCLRFANYFKEVPISKLSDDNFTEEEIEDVRERIKAGVLRRPTVVELELKAQMLHADVTKHWIAKEISLLQKRIDHVNEKGRLREKFEYIERRKLLNTPAEQEKLLLDKPKVIAEELEPEGVVPAGSSEKAEGSEGSPKMVLLGSSDISSMGASGSRNLVAPSQVIIKDLHAPKGRNSDMVSGDILVTDANGHDDTYETSKQPEEMKDHLRDPIQQEMWTSNVLINGSSSKAQGINPREKVPQEKVEQPTQVINLVQIIAEDQPRDPILQAKRTSNLINNRSSIEAQDVNPGEKFPKEKVEQPIQVIDLSDDDDDEPEGSDRKIRGEIPDEAIWNYMDPHGRPQGPFPLSVLKRWNDANYFRSDFKVWRNGQSSDDAVLLADILSQYF